MKNTMILALILVIWAGFCFAQTDSIPGPRYGHTMVVINDTCILLFGGDQSSRAVINELWAYNKDNSKWEKYPDGISPQERRRHAAAVLDGMMYIFGGEGATGLLDDIWKYDPSSNTWTECTSGGASLPAERKTHSATTVGDKIYVGGGIDIGDTAVGDFWSYDPSTGDWEILLDHPGPCAGHGALPFGGDIYMFGGYGGCGYYRNDVQRYDISANNWLWVDATGTLPPGWGYFASTPDQGATAVYTFGGEDASRSSVSQSYKFDPGTGIWTRLADCPAIFSHGAAAYGNTVDSISIFIFGGLDAAGEPTNDMWEYFIEYDMFVEVELSVEETPIQKPRTFALSAYPNPFNSAITIALNCHSRENGNPEDVAVEIFDINGRKVGNVSVGDGSPVPQTNGRGNCALTEVVWQPEASVGSGVYLVRAKIGDVEITKRVVYLK